MRECNLRKLKKHSGTISAKNVCTVHWSQKRYRKFTITAASDDNDQNNVMFCLFWYETKLKVFILGKLSDCFSSLLFVTLRLQPRTCRVFRECYISGRLCKLHGKKLSLSSTKFRAVSSKLTLIIAKILWNSALCSTENSLKKPRIIIRTFGRNFEESSREQKAKFGHFARVTFAQYCIIEEVSFMKNIVSGSCSLLIFVAKKAGKGTDLQFLCTQGSLQGGRVEHQRLMFTCHLHLPQLYIEAILYSFIYKIDYMMPLTFTP